MRTRLACLGFLTLLPALRAQHALIVNEHGTPQLVRAVQNHLLKIADGDRLRGIRSEPYGLSKAPIYGPGFLNLRQFQVRTWHLETVGSAVRLNYEIEVRGDLTSDTDLKNCFMVLALDFGKDKGIIFLEIPDLRSGRAEHLDYRFPVIQGIEEGRCQVYFFSDGLELLTSQMPPSYVEAQKRRTEEAMLRDQADRTVAVLHVVPPTYPPALQLGGSAGSAIIRCRIDASGRLSDATVASASHPEFGEAALAAVRQWQFGRRSKITTMSRPPSRFPLTSRLRLRRPSRRGCGAAPPA